LLVTHFSPKTNEFFRNLFSRAAKPQNNAPLPPAGLARSNAKRAKHADFQFLIFHDNADTPPASACTATPHPSTTQVSGHGF
jgi:hypothetical protein